MTDRLELAKHFAALHRVDTKSMTMIAGDASNRKYYRTSRRDQSVLIMDAPPEKGEDTASFVTLAQYLRSIGLSAPEILEADINQGFLLIEDLGDDLFARVIERDRNTQLDLYTAATDLLLHVHLHPAPTGVPIYDARTMADFAAVSVDWYAPDGTPGDGLQAALLARLRSLDGMASVLIHRDYHAENLLWLPERAGVARVGIIDFQDGMLCHPAFDLVSILQDARRDVPRTVEAEMLDRYIQTCNVDRQAFRNAYHVMGLQRNLRILGVFARLWLRDGRPNYLDLIPRVWEFVTRNLDALEDSSLSSTVLGTLPAATSDELDRIKGARS